MSAAPADSEILLFNAMEARAHLEFLFGEAEQPCWVAMAYASAWDPVKKRHGRWEDKRLFRWPEDADVLITSAEMAVGQHKDVYVCPHPRAARERSKKSGQPTGLILWADLDGNAPDSAIRAARDSGAVLLGSGTPGHLHAYWRLSEAQSREQIEERNKAMVEALGADHKWSNESLLRLAGTRNFKSGGEGAPVAFVVRPEDSRMLDAEGIDILERTPRPRKIPPRRAGVSGSGGTRSEDSYRQIRAMLETGARDEEIVRAVTSTAAYGHYRDAAHLREDIKRIREKAKAGGAESEDDDPPTKGPSVLEARMAETIAGRALRDRYLWSRNLGGWQRYRAGVWSPVDEAAVIEVVRLALIDLIAQETKARAPKRRRQVLDGLLSRNRITAIAFLARGIQLVDPDLFDAHPDLICTGNGVVDLETGAMSPHDPQLLLTKRTSVNYIAGATHPDWDQALEAMPLESRDWMQVKFGQGLTGHMAEDDVMAILQGSGENGKTTLLAGVKKAAGDYAVVVPERLLMARPSDHPTELTTLRGVRLAIIEEAPDRHLNTKRLKDTIGTPHMTARKIAKDNISWEATHTLMMSTNYHLRVNETDHATWRRLKLVVFPYTYTSRPTAPDQRSRDATLRTRLMTGSAQREAALAWLVEGARRWYAMGRTEPAPPARVEEDTAAWRCEADLVLAFCADTSIEFKEGCAVSTIGLYSRFCDWLEERHYEKWAENTFADRFGNHETVRNAGVVKKQCSDKTMFKNGGCLPDTTRPMSWIGVRLGR